MKDSSEQLRRLKKVKTILFIFVLFPLQFKNLNSYENLLKLLSQAFVYKNNRV